VTDWFVPGLKVGEDETLLEGDRLVCTWFEGWRRRDTAGR